MTTFREHKDWADDAVDEILDNALKLGILTLVDSSDDGMESLAQHWAEIIRWEQAHQRVNGLTGRTVQS